MKPIKMNVWGYCDYSDLIDSMEVETLGWLTLGAYQGDHIVLVKEGRRYGFVVIGYGSCSGCDALEGCYENIGEITALRDQIYASIHWSPKGSRKSLLRMILDYDWEGCSCLYGSEVAEVKKYARKVLGDSTD